MCHLGSSAAKAAVHRDQVEALQAGSNRTRPGLLGNPNLPPSAQVGLGGERKRGCKNTIKPTDRIVYLRTEWGWMAKKGKENSFNPLGSETESTNPLCIHSNFTRHKKRSVQLDWIVFVIRKQSFKFFCTPIQIDEYEKRKKKKEKKILNMVQFQYLSCQIRNKCENTSTTGVPKALTRAAGTGERRRQCLATLKRVKPEQRVVSILKFISTHPSNPICGGAR